MLSKRAGPFVVAVVAALLLVPSATAGAYADKSGDGGAAGDITGVAVVGDKSSGQVVFRITGNNIASSANSIPPAHSTARASRTAAVVAPEPQPTSSRRTTRSGSQGRISRRGVS